MHTSLSSQPTTSAHPGVRASSPHTQPTHDPSTTDVLPGPSCLGLNIPEMDLFDNDELDINPVLNAGEDSARADDGLPLIGALLVAEGLVTRQQLKACLLIQAQDHPNVQLGQIMLRSGYITESALDRVVELQQDIKASLIHMLEARIMPMVDRTALVLHRHSRDFICDFLAATAEDAQQFGDISHLIAQRVLGINQ